MTTKRLSDSQLVLKAKRAKELEAQAQEMLKRAATLKESVMKEMDRRGTRVIEHRGWKLTRVQTPTSVLDSDAILAALSPKQRRLCMKMVFDKQGLNAAVGAGLIDFDRYVKPHSEIKYNAPYLVATPVATH